MDSVMQKEMVKWELRQSMGEELMASSVYHVRALHAKEAGDEETAKLYKQIAKEEDEHYQEFGYRLNSGLSGGHFVPNNTYATNPQGIEARLRTEGVMQCQSCGNH